ncbi:MAG TPA: MFS transporter [Deltaproteobacteria bacterium]|nr:MFS transporter [Deltaproteobacteria bacterium]
MRYPSAFRNIPRTVWALGFVSLFMDISSEMIHSLLPVFLVVGLNASALSLGIIEGVAEATALITKVFSGIISDWMGRRKTLAVAGYALGTLTKPLFAMATGIQTVFAARFLDRIGKGIRGAPRDALLAEVTDESNRGAAFGLRQSLDTAGAFIGPVIASLMMFLFSNDFRAVFWVAVIPGIFAVLLLVLGVREPDRHPGSVQAAPMSMKDMGRLGRAFWLVTAFGAVFTLARFSEAFLLLRAQNLGVPAMFVPFFMVIMNVIYSLTAYPVGIISDKLGRLGMLTAGSIVLVVSDVVLAAAQSPAFVVLGVSLWGLHMGLTQGIFSALVADTSPENLRGSAFGIFSMVSGIAMLLASGIAGWLWDSTGPSATFLVGAAFAMAGLTGFIVVRHGIRRRNG